MKLPLRTVQLSWKATIPTATAAAALIAVIGLILDDPLALALQLVVIAAGAFLLLRHSTPNR
jgi:hypothetical protein